MALKGSGGRWEGSEADAESQFTSTAQPLGVVEVVCFSVAIGTMFWLCKNVLVQRAPQIFQRAQPEMHVFGNLAVGLAAYMFALGGVAVHGRVRLAGAMLASVVSVSLLYVLLFLNQSLYVTGFIVALGAGSSLCSRTGVDRTTGYAAGLVGAAVLLLAQVAGIWYKR